MAPPSICKCCAKTFAKKSTYIRHLLKKECGKKTRKRTVDGGYCVEKKRFPCSVCNAVFSSKYTKLKHEAKFHDSGNTLLFSCGVCDCAFATIPELTTHRETSHVYHHEFDSVQSAHQRRCERLRLYFPVNFSTLDEGLVYAFPRLVQLMETLLTEKSYFKTNLNCSVEMVKYGEQGEIITSEIFAFQAPAIKMARDYDWNSWHAELRMCLDHIQSSVYEFLHRGSGWCVLAPRFFEVEIAQCAPLAGSFNCALHNVCFNKMVNTVGQEDSPVLRVNSVGDGDGDDGACFYFAVAKGLLPKEVHDDIPKLRTFINKKLNLLPGAKRFNVRVSDIEQFEKMNEEMNLSINVVSYDEKSNIIPVRVRKIVKPEDEERTIVPLLLHKFCPADTGHVQPTSQAWHYAYIDDPLSLFTKRERNEAGRVVRTRRKYVCWNCMTLHSYKSSYTKHISYCHRNESQVLKMPKKGAVESFKNRLKAKKIVFNSAYILIWDFETLQVPPDKDCSCPPDVLRLPMDPEAEELEKERILDDMMEDERDYREWEKKKNASNRKCFKPFKFKNRRPRKICPHKTKILAEQPAFSYSTVLIDRQGTVRARNTYTGMDAAKHFVDYVMRLADEFVSQLSPGRPMVEMTEKQKYELRMSQHLCWICEERMAPDDRVIDHDHVSGEILGIAHNACNLNRKEVPQLTCFAHNFSGYDSHLILRELHASPLVRRVDGVPENTQKFKCLTVNRRVRFLDSMQFLQDGLAKLTDVLKTQGHDWSIVKQVVKDPAQLAAIDAKAPYPYNFATSIEDLEKQTQLPPMSYFDNDLADEPCDQATYEKAKEIWKVFECKNMVEFTQVYVSLDVLLLAEIVHNFKTDMYDAFQIDICQYLSLPHAAMDVMLKYTGAEFELVTDPEMADLLRKNIRGGLSFAGKRYSNPADNPREEGQRKSKAQRAAMNSGCYVGGEGGCLFYIDLNNLYGWSMMEPLPIDDFKWMTDAELKEYDFDRMMYEDFKTDGELGYIFEVDLSYPDHLHLKHNYMPLAPENKTIVYSDLSDYQKACYNALSAQPHNEEWVKKHYSSNKLTATFEPRKNYLVHYRNLALYLRHGLKLDKVHRGITFRQAPLVKPFIQKCTEMRRDAKTKSRKNVYKLIANSVYGKFIEDFSRRMDAFFNLTAESFLKRATSPLYRGSMIFGEDLSVSFLNKPKVDMKQVWPVGFTILELSKFKMQEMFYDAIQPAFGWGAVEVVMSDTDSFMLEVRGFTVDEARRKLARVMDFSNLAKGDPMLNMSRHLEPGYFKDECPESPIVKAVALKSKTYAFCTESGVLDAKTKGIKKSVKKKLAFDNFEICVRRINKQHVWQKNLRSKNHVNFKIGEWKKAFDSFDNKRFALCEIHTVPYGSVLIRYYRRYQTPNCFYCNFDTLNYYNFKDSRLGGEVMFLPHLDDVRPYWKKWIDLDEDRNALKRVEERREARAKMWLDGCTVGRPTKCHLVRDVLANLGSGAVFFFHSTLFQGTHHPNKIDAKHAYVGNGYENDCLPIEAFMKMGVSEFHEAMCKGVFDHADDCDCNLPPQHCLWLGGRNKDDPPIGWLDSF